MALLQARGSITGCIGNTAAHTLCPVPLISSRRRTADTALTN